MKGKNLSAAIAMVLVTSIISINDTTYATYKSCDDVCNNFYIGNIGVRIDEKKDADYTIDFEDIDDWKGEKEDKIVRVQNLSVGDAFIRVAITLRWVNEDGTPFAGDANIVKVNFVNDDKWIKDPVSGYYYYNEIINTNDYTKPIIDSVEAPKLVSEDKDKLDPYEKAKYRNKKLIIDVNAEAVQANKGLYKTVWNNLDSKTIEMLDNLESK